VFTKYNTLITPAWSTARAGVVPLMEGTSKIMGLKMLLKRSQRGDIENFDRDFTPY